MAGDSKTTAAGKPPLVLFPPAGTRVAFLYRSRDPRKVRRYEGNVAASVTRTQGSGGRAKAAGPGVVSLTIDGKTRPFVLADIDPVTLEQRNLESLPAKAVIDGYDVWGRRVHGKLVTEDDDGWLTIEPLEHHYDRFNPLVDKHKVLWPAPPRITKAAWQKRDARPYDMRWHDQNQVELAIEVAGARDGERATVEVFQRRKDDAVAIFAGPSQSGDAFLPPPAGLQDLVVRLGPGGIAGRVVRQADGKPPFVQFPWTPVIYESPYYYFEVRIGRAKESSGKSKEDLLYLRYTVSATLDVSNEFPRDKDLKKLLTSYFGPAATRELPCALGSAKPMALKALVLMTMGSAECLDYDNHFRHIAGRLLHVQSGHGDQVCGRCKRACEVAVRQECDFEFTDRYLDPRDNKTQRTCSLTEIAIRLTKPPRDHPGAFLWFAYDPGANQTGTFKRVEAEPGQRVVLVTGLRPPRTQRFNTGDSSHSSFYRVHQSPGTDDADKKQSVYRRKKAAWYCSHCKETVPSDQRRPVYHFHTNPFASGEPGGHAPAGYIAPQTLPLGRSEHGVPWKAPRVLLFLSCLVGSDPALAKALLRGGASHVIAFKEVVYGDDVTFGDRYREAFTQVFLRKWVLQHGMRMERVKRAFHETLDDNGLKPRIPRMGPVLFSP